EAEFSLSPGSFQALPRAKKSHAGKHGGRSAPSRSVPPRSLLRRTAAIFRRTLEALPERHELPGAFPVGRAAALTASVAGTAAFIARARAVAAVRGRVAVRARRLFGTVVATRGRAGAGARRVAAAAGRLGARAVGGTASADRTAGTLFFRRRGWQVGEGRQFAHGQLLAGHMLDLAQVLALLVVAEG